MTVEQISARIADLETRLSQTVFIDPMFDRAVVAILDAIRSEGYDVRIEVRSGDGEFIVAFNPSEASVRAGPPPEAKELHDSSWAVRCAATAWPEPRRSMRSEQLGSLLQSLGAVFNLHWGERDPAVLVRRLQDPGTMTRVLTFVEDAAQTANCLVLMHLDLDEFKKANDDEAVGDAVLREFAARLRQAFDGVGIITRTHSGDEFSGFFQCADPAELIERIEQFRKSSETEPFAGINRPNTSSIGLTIYCPPPGTRFAGKDQMLKDARAAERRAKSDGRNCIRISAAGAPPGASASGPWQELLRDMALRCRLDLHRNTPTELATAYGRIVAKQLTTRFAAVHLDDCGQVVREVVRVFGLQLDPTATIPEEADGSLSDWMSVTDWASVVAWALLRATFASGAPLAPDDTLSYKVITEPEGRSYLALHVARADGSFRSVEVGTVQSSEITEVPIGAPWYPVSQTDSGTQRWLPEDTAGLSPCFLQPSVFLLIGEDGIAIAGKSARLAADVINVDDRPVKGGGLPDFWQSNLTRVIRSCLRNPNIQEVFVVGDVTNASKTVEWLKASTDTWTKSLPDLQRRLAIPIQHLAAFRERNLHLTIVESTLSLLAQLSRASQAVSKPTATSAVDLKTVLARQRRVGMVPLDEKNRLSVTDGLRSRTLADAYPHAIQLLRNQADDFQVEPTGRRFSEIQSFKLVLTEPLQEQVPDYWRPEAPALQEYYEKNFKDKDGLFQRQLSLAHDEGNESEHAYALRTCIENLRLRRPTRRVTLPLAAFPKGHRDPIGWFSIQIFPRLRGGRWYLHFNWIWRTVEVLVGFPFSVYGSIEWSRDFHAAVQQELSKGENPVAVEFGELIYIALSFHIFLDDGDMEIARSIFIDALG